MYIYEVIHETDNGMIDHTVVTARSEKAATKSISASESQILSIENCGTYRRHDIYTEIRDEIISRGVPNKTRA